MLSRSGSAHLIHIWGLKSGGTPTLLHVMEGHTGQILCVRVSRDCQKLVSVSDDKTACVWNVETGILMATCSGGRNALRFAAWSPDSKIIAISGGKSSIPMFEAATGRMLKGLQEPDIPWPEHRVVHLAFVTDVSVLMCANVDTEIMVYVLGCERAWRGVKGLVGHKNGVTSMTFSPDNKYIASASWDNTVRVWDAKTANMLHVFRGHSMGPNCLVWSPNGDFIVSASSDWTACVWSVDEQVCT
jgi:WD40 repeat protein